MNMSPARRAVAATLLAVLVVGGVVVVPGLGGTRVEPFTQFPYGALTGLLRRLACSKMLHGLAP